MKVRHIPFFLLLAACTTYELKQDTSGGEPQDTGDTGDAEDESAGDAARAAALASPASLPTPPIVPEDASIQPE